jgi:hypothetical protein
MALSMFQASVPVITQLLASGTTWVRCSKNV